MTGRGVVGMAFGSAGGGLLAAVAGWIVTVAVLPYGVPPEAAAVLALAVSVLAVGLVSLVLARRGSLESWPAWAAGLLGPSVLAAFMAVGSSAVWWFRLVGVLAILAAALAGLRAGDRDQAGSTRYLRAEHGSGSLELVGVFTLAAVLVAAVVGAVGARDPRIRDAIWAQICKITGGECSLSAAPSNAQYKPADCEIYSAENKVNATVDITFVRLGGGGMVQRVEKSNGDIEITMLYEGRGGLVASAGAKGSITVGENTFGAGWDAEAAVTAGYQSGDTYVFTDREQADDFQDYLQRELGEDSAHSLIPFAGAINSAVEWATGEEAPTNNGVQKTYVRYDGTAEASISGSVGYGTSAGADVSAMVALGSELDRGKDAGDPSDDTKTDFYQVDWSAGAQIGLPVVKGASASYQGSGIVKVTRDAQGEPISVQIVDRAQGGFQIGLNATDGAASGIDPNAPEQALNGWGVKLTGGEDSSTVITQTLDLDTPERQQAFEDWFSWGNGLATADRANTPNWMSDTEHGEAVMGSEEFAELMGEQAKVSIVEYDGTTWGLGANVEAGLGIKGGIDIGYTDTETRSVQAAYLGAPDEEGGRATYDLPECVS